jgi:1-acyl-sn-glycerol-3-phosphate acyltransferase
MKKAARFILRISGWKITDDYPPYSKSVCVMAPHTSMWDFVWGKLYFMSMGLKPHFLIKKEMFRGLVGPLLKKLGGIPVDRSKAANTVNDIVRSVKGQDNFLLVITPEGTRKKVDRWKTGALRIAHAASMPLVEGRMDYKKKELGVIRIYESIPDDKAFINQIKSDFAEVSGKHPEKFNPYAKQ